MKDDKVYLSHILDELGFINKKSKRLTFSRLQNDETLKRAIVRSLEVIGEATKNISKEYKSKHPDIAWREMAGLRDKLIHFYFGVDWKIVWDVVKKEIPGLQDKIRDLLDE